MIILYHMLNLVCLKAYYNKIIKQVMRMNENYYHDGISKMIEICDVGKGDKRAKEFVTGLYKRMKECQDNKSQQKSKQNGEISIYICINENKQPNCYNESLIMASLLYLFIRFKFIRVNFHVQTLIPKQRRQDSRIKMSLTRQFDLNLTKQFYNGIQSLMSQIHFEIRQASAHFEQIRLKCQGMSIDHQNAHGKQQIMKLRQDTYQFIYQFYENLSQIFINKKMFFFCVKERIQSLEKSQLAIYGQELYVKKILKKQESFYINTLVIKIPNENLVQDLMKEENEEKIEDLQGQQEDHQYQQNLGYFSQFHGNQFQFLSKLLIIFCQPSDLSSIKKILPRIPNISSLKIHKQSQEMVIGEINQIVKMMVVHNRLIEIFWLQKIRVQIIPLQLLQTLYQQCPYLYEFHINIRFKYLIQQTYAYSNPQEKQLKENQRQSQILLNALRMRRISLNHNLDMAKMLIKRKYKFNQIIQVIDCIQPICF